MNLNKLFLVPVLLCLPFTISSGAAATNESPILGFSSEAASREHALETQFDSGLKRENLREWMKKITAHPRHLGSPYDKEMSEFIAGQFRSWGYETEVEEFEVLFPTPKLRLLEMTAPEKFTAGLAELTLKEDATSGLTSEQLPGYHVYSIDGDVTGELVYVNYGIPKDYETLAEHGVDVKGKIVIARYGGSWRGIKPKVAAEHGALGCIIYSDPRDDGYYEGDVYPKGPWRNDHGVQRGSVLDMPLYPGDPLTPGIGATKDAKRIPIKDAPTLTKIPVLPISYSDALPLLRALDGPVAPETWRGALPVTYHLGPGPATVHLKLEFDWKMVTARDIIAKMPGATRPDEWIIRGNHYDAWVCGAEDPVSGAVTLMEEARSLSELAKTGWKPKRTVVFTVWDGEEPGLIGSTEWVETHADLLKQKAAVYVNTDNTQRGFLRISGSHTLEKFMNEIAREVMDPERNISLADRWRAQLIAHNTGAERAEIRTRPDLRIAAMGSGSDYTPFLQHLGIASLNLGFESDEGGGSYHSIYDSFDWYTRFGDTNFNYCLTLAKTSGRAVMRLADADVLPFEFSDFADTVGRYITEVSKLADELREETKENNRLIQDKTLLLIANPAKVYVEPQPKGEVPYINFSPLHNALVQLQKSAAQFESVRKQMGLSEKNFPPEANLVSLDEILMRLEQSLTHAAGLPRRPWFQHTIYAPGFYTGYGVKTLPGVREALEQRDWDEAARQIEVASATIEKFASEVDHARKVLASQSEH